MNFAKIFFILFFCLWPGTPASIFAHNELVEDQPTILSLPDEIIIKITSYISGDNMISWRATCKDIDRIVSDRKNHFPGEIWLHRFLRTVVFDQKAPFFEGLPLGHWISIDDQKERHNFQIMETLVTQGMIVDITGKNPSFFKEKKHCPDGHKIVYINDRKVIMCTDHPAENISVYQWEMLVKSLNKISLQKAKSYNESHYYKYAVLNPTQARYLIKGNEIASPHYPDSYVWGQGNSGQQTHPVKSFPAGDHLPHPNNHKVFIGLGSIYELIIDPEDETVCYSCGNSYEEAYKGLHFIEQISNSVSYYKQKANGMSARFIRTLEKVPRPKPRCTIQ